VEYVNVLNGNTWIGWSEVFTNKGGTITGNISIERDSVPMIELVAPNTLSRIMKNSSETSDGGLIIKDYADDSDSSSGAYIRLSHKIAKENLSEALKFALIGNGTTSSYNIFGEHNREAMGVTKTEFGSYVGTGTYGANNPCSLTFQWTPKIIVLYGEITYQNGDTQYSHFWDNIDFGILPTSYTGRQGFGITSTSGTAIGFAKKTNNTIFWYNTQSALHQKNESSCTYHYMAIG
jgi:hypothetical protein